MKKGLIIMMVAVAVIFCSCDKDDGHNGRPVSEATTRATSEYVANSYENARIIEIERERGMYKVEIIHNNIEKDVYFSMDHEWLYTEWDIRISNLPQAVLDAIAQTQYAAYVIDDADFVQKPGSEYYVIELEQGRHEARLSITAQGVIL